MTGTTAEVRTRPLGGLLYAAVQGALGTMAVLQGSLLFGSALFAMAGYAAVRTVGEWLAPDAERPIWIGILMGVFLSYMLIALAFMFMRY